MLVVVGGVAGYQQQMDAVMAVSWPSTGRFNGTCGRISTNIPGFRELVAYDDKVVVVLDYSSFGVCLGLVEVYPKAIARVPAFERVFRLLQRARGLDVLGGELRLCLGRRLWLLRRRHQFCDCCEFKLWSSVSMQLTYKHWAFSSVVGRPLCRFALVVCLRLSLC
jgi:hypothetical protein